MYIKTVEITNYKSYRETGPITLTPGMNLVVGRNNVGKTALLEAIAAQLKGNHHHFGNIKYKNQQITLPSRVNLEIAFTIREIFQFLPISQQAYSILTPIDFSNGDKTELLNRLNDKAETISVFIKYDKETNVAGTSFESAKSASLLVRKTFNPSRTYIFRRDGLNESFVQSSGTPTDFFAYVGNYAVSKMIFRFVAERFHLNKSYISHELKLETNASNLPGCLLRLNTKAKNKFDKLCGYLNEIFPNVFWVSPLTVESQNSNEVEVKIWPVPNDSDRDDLLISLENCGTGVSQVLAILFVVLTSDFPQVIIIDEPNSFLHPGAAKKLIQILNMYPQHQYIIATHSTEVIRTARPNNILHLTTEGMETKIQTLSGEDFTATKDVLRDVGASLSDVFAADSILWVEGKTEEECFKLILGEDDILRKVSILGVLNTGDFEKSKKTEATIELYNKLSKSNAIQPPAIGFLFDRERRSEADIEDIERRAGQNFKFLDRMMFENYLIHADAIAAVLNTKETFKVAPLNSEAISQWILKNGGDAKYMGGQAYDLQDISDKAWLKAVHGANLLKNLFEELSQSKEPYDKVGDGMLLTKWLVDNRAETFAEVRTLLMCMLNPEAAGG